MRTLLIVLTIIFMPVISVAENADGQRQANSPANLPASYLLQITSNLNCEVLGIKLISDDTTQLIRFKKSAFAAVDLPAGQYEFGDVICINGDKSKTLDLLKDKIASFTLNSGKAYFGGRLIFQAIETNDLNAVPKVLANCTRNISRARGEVSDECRDGVGVDGSANTAEQIRVFAPEVSDEALDTIRKTLSLAKDQLLYLPIKLN